MRAFSLPTLAVGAALLLGAGCAGEPFGYAADRCVGSYNQCAASCTSIGDGPARAACADRCLASETRCYGAGDEGSALSVNRAIGEARTERQKQEDYERWKAQRDRESAEKEANGQADEESGE